MAIHRHPIFHALLGGAVALGLAALVPAVLQSPATPAMAQTATPATAAPVTFSAAKIQEITPTNPSGRILEIISVPNTPVFMVRTASAITIYERRNNGVRTLLDVTLNDSYRSVQILDDGRTVLLHTERAVGVYTIDSRIVQSTPRR